MTENTTIDKRVKIDGTVFLILYDDTTLTLSKGIHLAGNNQLDIFAQSGGSGWLVATGEESCSAIGGNADQPGEYMYVEKVKERYTMHTRTVTTTVNGRTQTRTETYWTWDRVGSEDIQCDNITFLGIEFDSNKIELPASEYIKTIKESGHVRYKYYVVNTSYTGTIFTDLRDDTISDNSAFYNDMTIEETMDHLDSNVWLVVFWIAWSLLICGCVVGFYYIDNRWLE